MFLFCSFPRIFCSVMVLCGRLAVLAISQLLSTQHVLYPNFLARCVHSKYSDDLSRPKHIDTELS